MSDREAHKKILEQLYEGRRPFPSNLQVQKKWGKINKTLRQPSCPGPTAKGTEHISLNNSNKFLDRKPQQSFRNPKGKGQHVQELEHRYGLLRLNPVDHTLLLDVDVASEVLEDAETRNPGDVMPGVKRPAKSLEDLQETLDNSRKATIAGRTELQLPTDLSVTIIAAEQTPKQKTRFQPQRQNDFVDLTADDSDEPGPHARITADNTSPMSTGRSPSDKASTPEGSLPSGSPMAISPQVAEPSGPSGVTTSSCQIWQPKPSRFQPEQDAEGQDMLEGTAGLAVSGCASETEEEQLQDESLPGGRQRPATGTAPKTAGSELRGPTQAHRAAAETYRAALAALNQRGLPQELPPPPAAPCQQLQPLERRQRAAAGPMDARPVCQQLPERLGSARQPSISSRLAWPQPRQALASNATTAVAFTLSISQAAALQEYKDALRVASGLPPELPSPSIDAQKSSRTTKPARVVDNMRTYRVFKRQQEAAEFADQCNKEFATLKQQQRTTSAGLPGSARGLIQQRAALSTQTANAMEEGRAASAVARTAQACAGTWMVPANTQQLACMEEGLPAAAEAEVGGLDRCQQTEASTSASQTDTAEHVKVFCEEVKSKGGESYYRQFVAARYDALWASLAKRHHTARHFYEVVREGRPCHMYFDLEYVPTCNPLVDGDMMVTILLNLVRMGVRELWGLQLEDSWVWELDSSSPSKWSRHIIVVVPGRAFPSNLAVGAFVNQILSLPQAAQLRVEKTDGHRTGERHFTSLVDTAVYTKNRHFRTAFSCKGGKGHVLQSTGRFAASLGTQLSDRELFMRTLVCNVEPGARPLAVGAAEQLLRTRAGPSARRTAQLTDSAEGLQVLQTAAAAVKVSWKRDSLDDGLPLLAPIEELQRWGQQVVAFIEDVAKQCSGGAPATVRTIAHCGTAGLIAYSMLGPGSHYCENIGRCHASNHVYFVVSLSEGQYAQKCYDPDCAHFRSAWMPLPPHLLLSPDSIRS